MSFRAMSISPSVLGLPAVIGVIEADVSYLVASLFALTHVAESQQSIASGIVAMTGGVWSSIFNAISAALISSNLTPLEALTITGIGGNQIQDAAPIEAELEQLLKGFQAQILV